MVALNASVGIDMKGAEAVIKARLAGVAPGAIYFIDHPDNAPLELGCVDIRGDNIPLLDLRFVAGMLVCVTSETNERMEQLVAQCRKFRARQIAYSLYRKYYE